MMTEIQQAVIQEYEGVGEVVEEVLNSSLESITTEIHCFGQEDKIKAETKRKNYNQAIIMETGELPGGFRGFGLEEEEIQMKESPNRKKNLSPKERRKRNAVARSQ